MSRSKLSFLTVLVVVVVLAAVRSLEVETGDIDHAAFAQDQSLRYAGRLSDELVRLSPPVGAISSTSSSTFLPVQSQNPADLGTGKLLVASRALGDPNFAETVVLLVHCDADGVVGLILNRRTDIPLSRVLEQFDAAKGRSDPAYLGGPVETPAVFALLQSTAKLDGAEQVFSGVYLITAKSAFEKTIAGRPDPGIFHVYLGYAGWSNDQLQMEVKLGSWFIFQGDARTVFDADPDSLWRQMIQKTELKSAGGDPHALEPFGAKPKLRS